MLEVLGDLVAWVEKLTLENFLEGGSFCWVFHENR